jgi:hypothetical protein
LTFTPLPYHAAMPTERRVDTFDLTDLDSRAAYEDLSNRSSTHVQTEQTFPMGDGSVLRVVDYTAPSEIIASKPVYERPIC